MTPQLPGQWQFAASAFNWTPEIAAARQPAADIVAGIVAGGVAKAVELEPGLHWRSFPAPADGEVDSLREALAGHGGRATIVGASLDDFTTPTARRSTPERLDFLAPQLHAAHRVGAVGVRLPLGQAGAELLRLVQPLLHELDLVLYEEIQGQQVPARPDIGQALELVSGLADSRVRILVDISMLMPALPVTYLEALERGGIPAGLMARLSDEWLDPATMEAVVSLLRSGELPPAVHTLYMNLLVRFGRSDTSVLRDLMPLVGAFHLKFWDLDDADGRVSEPLRDLGRLLSGTSFAGTLTSEWGGHEWLQEDPTAMTRRHLAMAKEALAAGAAG